MFITRQQARDHLQAIGAAPFFLTLYDESAKRRRSASLPKRVDPFDLTNFFRPPDLLFMVEPREQEDHTRSGKWIPLLDDGNSTFVYLHDPAADEFIELDVETNTVRTTFRNWPQVLAQLFLRMNGLYEPDELREIAGVIEFGRVDAALAFMAEPAGDASWEQIRDRQRAFVASLG